MKQKINLKKKHNLTKHLITLSVNILNLNRENGTVV